MNPAMSVIRFPGSPAVRAALVALIGALAALLAVSLTEAPTAAAATGTTATGTTASMPSSTATTAPASTTSSPTTTSSTTTGSTTSTTTTTTTSDLRLRRAAIQLRKSRRIIRIAKRWVGTRYTWGGTSPSTGFDCSGYTRFVFRRASVARLPHQSERQRHAYRMHRIRRRHARPGDLIFYMSGGRAYHVAIFDGHGGQFSAVDRREGVRHQKIYAHNIQFRTDWHR